MRHLPPISAKTLPVEACHSDGALALDQPVSIHCGEDSETAGQATFIPAPKDSATAHAALAQFVRSAGQNLNCEDTQWIGDGRTALRICTLKSNGWPRIVLGAQSGTRLYRAEGSPSRVARLAGRDCRGFP